MKYFDKIMMYCSAAVVAWVLVNGHDETPVGAMGVKAGLASTSSGDGVRMSTEARRHMNRGHELEKSQDFAGAVECYAMVVTDAPRSPEAHFRLAEALRNSGRLQAALLSYTLAIAIDPQHVGSLEGRARLCSRLEYHGQALRDLSKLIELRPSNAEYHYLRGSVKQHRKVTHHRRPILTPSGRVCKHPDRGQCDDRISLTGRMSFASVSSYRFLSR